MTLVLADTSVWNRSHLPAVAPLWSDLVLADQLAICPQVRLEFLYSMRSPAEYDLARVLTTTPHELASGAEVWARAEVVQAALARKALHHRSVGIADLVIAATAELAGAELLHYDEDFERIASITGQAIVWVAPPGSL